MSMAITHRICGIVVCLASLSLPAGIAWGQDQESQNQPAAGAAQEPAGGEPAKKEEAPQDEAKKDEAKKDEAKKDEAKKDEAKKDEAKKDEAKKDETKKGEPAKPADEEKKPADAAAAEGSPAALYEAKLAEWKQLLKDLRELKGRYDKADPSQLDGLRDQFQQLIAKGEQELMPELRAAAMKAYEAAPNEDRQLTRLLGKMLEDEMNRDAYESALPLARMLVDNGSDMREAFQAAGVASFATGDFETAEKYLKDTEGLGGLSDEGRKFLGLLDDYKKFAAEEAALRKKEAEADDLPRVKLATSKGDIVVELFENEAPETVGNFVSLVEKGFYDNKVFHRVLKGFMAQGGCPKGDGSGGPGYNIYCECYKENYRKHFRGTLSMAHAGRDTGGSQFFITFIPTDHLNGKHTAFGRVIEGLEVLERLQRLDPQGSEKAQPDKIIKAEMLRKRDHEYVPHKVQ